MARQLNTHSAPLKASLTVFALAALAVTLTPSSSWAFFGAGVEVFTVAGGTGTVTNVQSDSSGELESSNDYDDTTGLGYTAYGRISVFPFVSAGLALHYIPTLEFSEEDKTSTEFGSETDINLLVSVGLPIPIVDISIYGEGGLTHFSLSDEYKDTFSSSFGDNEASSIGYNYGAGLKIGYGIIPLLGIHLDIAYQRYAFDLFQSSFSEAALGTTEVTSEIEGDRIRLGLGVGLSF